MHLDRVGPVREGPYGAPGTTFRRAFFLKNNELF
jgi:hypothetical protein